MKTMRLRRGPLRPGADEVAVGDHVHGLEGEAAGLARVGQDALGAQQVLSPFRPSTWLIQALKRSGSTGRATSKDMLRMSSLCSCASSSRKSGSRARMRFRSKAPWSSNSPIGTSARVAGRMRAVGLMRRMRASTSLAVGVRDQVQLVQHDYVGEGDLLAGLGAVLQPGQQVLGVSHRDDGVQAGLGAHALVHEEGLRHGAGIGQAGGLDDDAVEPAAALHQPADDADQVAAHGAADAAVVHLEHFLVGVHHQVVVHAELAELVDHHGVFLAVVFSQDAVQQRWSFRRPGSRSAHSDRDLVGAGRGKWWAAVQARYQTSDGPSVDLALI